MHNFGCPFFVSTHTSKYTLLLHFRWLFDFTRMIGIIKRRMKCSYILHNEESQKYQNNWLITWEIMSVQEEEEEALPLILTERRFWISVQNITSYHLSVSASIVTVVWDFHLHCFGKSGCSNALHKFEKKNCGTMKEFIY